MTEREFWIFLEDALAKGRISQVSGCIDSDNIVIQKTGEYLNGHSVLFKGHDKIPISMVHDLGELILKCSTTLKAKEAILIILAHHSTKAALEALIMYNKNPDEPLKYIAQLALEECEWWN